MYFNANLFAQGRNTNWCFGDSAGINFSNLSNPINFKSSCNTLGESATISDSIGKLLFYATGRPNSNSFKSAKIFNHDNTLMQNGDSLLGDFFYETEVILPYPEHDSLFYVFTIDEDIDGLYFNLVKKSNLADSGIVLQKNIPLIQTAMANTIQAIKHGNGRDWWLVTLLGGTIPSDTFYVWNISPSGLSQPIAYNIGFNTLEDLKKICFNSDGSKFIEVSVYGIVQEFNFDRCTGIISSNRIIRQPEPPMPSWVPSLVSAAYSANDRYLYIVQLGLNFDSSMIVQLDMNLNNPWPIRDTIWTLDKRGFTRLKLAPDNKIYASTWYWYNGSSNPFPYPDTIFFLENSYLSVINTPDSPGVSCTFTPFSFYLGGARTYAGLSNQPNYSLGPTADSCIFAAIPQQQTVPVAALNLMYHQQWQTLFVNANAIKGKKYTLRIYNTLGKLVYENSGKTDTYFTKDVACPNYSAGVYIVNLETEKEKLSGKFVVN